MSPVSVLYREPKLLKAVAIAPVSPHIRRVSVLYREPKLLKGVNPNRNRFPRSCGFSALP